MAIPDADHFPARVGQLLNGRYEILRKLGGGVYSSSYLIKEPTGQFQSKYLAVKVLTAEATKTHHEGVIDELGFLQKIAKCEDINSLPILRDNFEVQGPLGPHLCLVMDLLSTDVSSFRRSAPKKALPPHVVKAVLVQVLEALEQLHELGIIHTDLKLDNILFNSITGDDWVESQLQTHPVSFEGDYELNGEKYPILRPQPIPHTFKWDVPPITAEIMNFVVTDLGQAQWAGKQPTVNEFSAYALRAPELILQSDFGPKLDIWALGCITFEMLTGNWLFAPVEGEDWRLEDDHLAKMMELTGERFSQGMLSRAYRRDEYFNPDGKLLRIDDLQPMPVEDALRNYGTVPEKEISGASSFIRACLRFDVHDRATAKELIMHDWMRTANCAHH